MAGHVLWVRGGLVALCHVWLCAIEYHAVAVVPFGSDMPTNKEPPHCGKRYQYQRK